jgi:DnaJ-class molecular chaperone
MSFFFSVGGRDGAKQQCTTCRGHGIQIITRQIGPNMMQRMQQVCKDCSGEGKQNKKPIRFRLKKRNFFFKGEIINERDRCKTCQGKKTIDQKKKLEVVISPGQY